VQKTDKSLSVHKESHADLHQQASREVSQGGRDLKADPPKGCIVRLGLQHDIASASFDQTDLRVALAHKQGSFAHPITGETIQEGKDQMAA